MSRGSPQRSSTLRPIGVFRATVPEENAERPHPVDEEVTLPQTLLGDPSNEESVGGNALREEGVEVEEEEEDNRSYELNETVFTIQEVELTTFRRAYHIPKEIGMRVPDFGEFPSNPLEGEVAMSLRFFTGGVRLPHQRPVADILRAVGLAPSQLNPNFWRCVVGVVALARSLGEDLMPLDFRCPYSVVPHRGPKGRPTHSLKGVYYCSPWFKSQNKKLHKVHHGVR